jgi:hypothetical protein
MELEGSKKESGGMEPTETVGEASSSGQVETLSAPEKAAPPEENTSAADMEIDDSKGPEKPSDATEESLEEKRAAYVAAMQGKEASEVVRASGSAGNPLAVDADPIVSMAPAISLPASRLGSFLSAEAG